MARDLNSIRFCFHLASNSARDSADFLSASSPIESTAIEFIPRSDWSALLFDRCPPFVPCFFFSNSKGFH